MAKRRLVVTMDDSQLEALLIFIERSNHGDYRCYSDSLCQADNIKLGLERIKKAIEIKLGKDG